MQLDVVEKQTWESDGIQMLSVCSTGCLTSEKLLFFLISVSPLENKGDPFVVEPIK